MRQNLGSVLARLQADGEPILVEKGRTPIAVLISLADYQKRFVDLKADAERRKILDEIKAAQIGLPHGTSSLGMIRELREGQALQ